MRLLASFTLAALCLVGFNLLAIQGSDPFPTQQAQIEKDSQARDKADEAIAKSITDLSEQVRLLRGTAAGAEATTEQISTLRTSIETNAQEISILESKLKERFTATLADDTESKLADLEARVAAIEARCKCGLPQASTQASQYPKATGGSTGSAPVSQAPVVAAQAPVIATVAPVVTPQRTVTRTVEEATVPLFQYQTASNACYIDANGNQVCPNQVAQPMAIRQTQSTTVDRPGLLGRIFGR